MAALVVPTIFTAVDRISGVVDRMKRSVGGFAGKASIGINALNKGINKLIPSLGGLGNLIKNFAIYTALVGVLRFAGDSLVKYEQNVAHLHAILSDLTKAGLKPFEDQIKRTAWQTRESAVDVAAAYANIAELNPDLAKTEKSLDGVARASILLSQASRIPLSDAASSLVTIMTQFRLGADQADRIVQTLAAGNKFGAAPIDKAAEALTRFASVARRANVSIEQSNALVQVLAAGGIQGSEAGNAIKASITRLQRAGAGYGRDGKGNFDVGRAFGDVLKVYNRIKTAKGKDKFLFDIFGLHQLSKSGELLDSLGKVQKLTQLLTGTTEASKQAAIQTDTLAKRWDQLKATFVNWLIINPKVNSGMDKLKKIIVYITNNLDDIVSGMITAVKWFIRIKAAIWGVQAALFAYNLYIGIAGALTGVANIAIGQSPAALLAYRIALGLSTAATWLWNGSLNAIFWSLSRIAGATGFRAIVAGLGSAAVATGAVLALFAIIANYSKVIYDNWDAIKKVFTSKGILAGLAVLGRALTAALVSPIQEALRWLGKLTGWQWVKDFADNKGGPKNKGEWADWMIDPDNKDRKPALMTVNAQAANAERDKKQKDFDQLNGTLGIHIIDPKGYVGGTTQTGNVSVMPKLSSTTGNK